MFLALMFFSPSLIRISCFFLIQNREKNVVALCDANEMFCDLNQINDSSKMSCDLNKMLYVFRKYAM